MIHSFCTADCFATKSWWPSLIKRWSHHSVCNTIVPSNSVCDKVHVICEQVFSKLTQSSHFLWSCLANHQYHISKTRKIRHNKMQTVHPFQLWLIFGSTLIIFTWYCAWTHLSLDLKNTHKKQKHNCTIFSVFTKQDKVYYWSFCSLWWQLLAPSLKKIFSEIQSTCASLLKGILTMQYWNVCTLTYTKQQWCALFWKVCLRYRFTYYTQNYTNKHTFREK